MSMRMDPTTADLDPALLRYSQSLLAIQPNPITGIERFDLAKIHDFIYDQTETCHSHINCVSYAYELD